MPDSDLSRQAQQDGDFIGLHEQAKEKIREELRKQIRGGATQIPDFTFPIDRIQKELRQPKLDQTSDLFYAVNGTQGTTIDVKRIEINRREKSSCQPGSQTASYKATIRYTLLDRYNFTLADDVRNENKSFPVRAFGAMAYLLQQCGRAYPFEDYIIIQRRIAGEVQLDPANDTGENCDPPDDDDNDASDIPVVRPRDPNDILGPAGYGDARWVAAEDTLGYIIRFENDESIATAPAQRVTIEQTLDGDLDPRRFRLGAFGFGDYLFDVPENRSFYNARLGPLTIVSRTYYVDVTAGIDIITGKAFWIFQSIDPATGAPPTDALAGFLPPDFNNGDGQGFVTYNVRPKSSTVTGARVDAQARIVFDDQDPIDTPPIFNTIDVDPPSSTMTALPAQTTATDVVLNWTSSDAANGSGLAGVDLYVARDDAPFALWQSNIAETATVFTGEQGHRYGFFALAKDNAGNREATKAVAETATFIYLPGIPYTMTLAATPNQIVANGRATSTVVATVVDAVNAPVAGAVVTFTASQGTVAPLTAMTNGSGSVTATFTAGAGVGLATVQANVGAISRTTTISLTAGAPTTITLTVTPTALTANGNSMATVTARVVDALLNPIAGKSIVFTGTLGSITPLTQTLDAAGLATTTFTAGTLPGIAVITAQIEGITETVQIVLAAAHFSTTITTQETGILLRWPAGLGFGEYAIHRSPMPFFTPGADTLIATAPATAVSYHDPNTAALLNGGYYYLVRGVGGGAGVNSNQVGVINYRLNNVGNQYSLIALPFLPDGVTNAATLASYIGNVNALLKWNPATQSFQFFAAPNAGDNFTLTQGAALFVKVNSGGPTLMTLTGSVTSSQHTLTPGGFNFVSIPLQKGNLTDATALAADLTAVQSLLAWNENTQAFRFFAPPTNGDNFAVWPGMPFIVSMTANGPTHWPIDLTAAAPPSNTGGQPSLVDLTLITPAAYNAEEHNAASRSTLYLPLIKRE